MRVLTDSIEIKVSPNSVWDWILHFTENYCDWHPSHIKAYWKEGEPNKVGSVIYSEEDIKGERLKLIAKITEIIPNQLLRFKTLGTLKLILKGGTFQVKPKGTNSLFIATLDFRIGKFLSKVAKKTVKQITQHMIEEGENLKKILENKSN